MDPLISIIIPTKNEEKNIESCLESIKKQNYKKIEVIVVDNNSTDKTLQLAKNFTKNIYQKGPERSTQRNFGTIKAKGSYFLFVDADMELTKNCLQQAVNKAQNGKYIVAFPELSRGKSFWEKSIALERNLYQKEKILAAARLFPKELYLKLKGYDQKMVAGEDWDLTIRARKSGYQLSLSDSELIHKEKVESLRSILKKKKYYSLNIHLYAQKHPEEFQLQSSLKIRLGIYLKNWRYLISDLPHAFGFIIIKVLVWYNWSIKKLG